MSFHRALCSVLAICFALAAPVSAQQDDPTAYLREDRSAEPPLMPWQRNLEDALALSQATGKPLLICVNIDGELASEALAADRYRDPDFVALVDGFIPVLASPDRHGAFDYTSRGVRLPDPKFGRVTSAEHIAIEPELFERWFEGRRVAPRHVGVSPSGEVLFDLYLLTDLSLIDAALAEHGKFPETVEEVEDGSDSADAEAVDAEAADDAVADTEEAPELDEAALLESPDAAHRELLEARFVAAEAANRTRLARAALMPTRATAHPELVRLALLDPADEVRAAGLAALVENPEAGELELFYIAARVAFDSGAAGTSDLITALERFATASPEGAALRAMQLARGLRAAELGSDFVDVEAWLLGTGGRVAVEEDRSIDWDERLARIEERLRDDPDNADWNVLFARNGRQYALDLLDRGGNPSLVLEDVRQSARRALNVRPDDALAGALYAWSSYMLGDSVVACDTARLAVRGLQPWSASPLAFETMNILADTATRRLYGELEQGVALSAGLLADAIAAHEVLLEHPLGTEEQALRGLQLLGSVRLDALQRRAVENALERWQDSGAMHEWYRWVVLRDEGPDGLLTAYDVLELNELSAAQRYSYGGLAKLHAAERRMAERQPLLALDDYRLAIQELEDALAESAAVSSFARWYQVQARGGRARIYLDAGRLDEALAEILLCFALESDAHDQPDARGVKPRATLNDIHAALLEAGMEPDAQSLERFLEPPATESEESDS